jgi:diaminopropionate ammonia-lyase
VSRYVANERAEHVRRSAATHARAALGFHRSMPGYRPAPLLSVPSLARKLGIASLLVKDLSECFGLPAFKILGASWAVNCAVAEHLGAAPALDFARLLERARGIEPLRLVTATDGNHGRAVAHMAALLGLKATIYVPAGTARARIEGIASEGALVEVVDGTYDDAVARAAQEAGPRCLVVSDTSWPGYESTPGAVIDGYATILDEIDEQVTVLGAPPPDLVLVQCGVGAFAAAVAAHYQGEARPALVGTHCEDEGRPALVAVEPDDAACLLAALAAGRVVTIPGPHRSVMAGLNCGTVSLVAWPVLQRSIDLCVTVDDGRAHEAMRLLAGAGIESGESGAAGLAGLLALLSAPELAAPRARFAIGPASRVLVFLTEGATDPAEYARVVGRR